MGGERPNVQMGLKPVCSTRNGGSLSIHGHIILLRGRSEGRVHQEELDSAHDNSDRPPWYSFKLELEDMKTLRNAMEFVRQHVLTDPELAPYNPEFRLDGGS